ncbi:MAG TPA: hypothetical protein VNG12_22935, partial [Acidimicrobiales bacterium]|nr:hypothetical protein [Acidimicrobiales bacterium]
MSATVTFASVTFPELVTVNVSVMVWPTEDTVDGEAVLSTINAPLWAAGTVTAEDGEVTGGPLGGV